MAAKTFLKKPIFQEITFLIFGCPTVSRRRSVDGSLLRVLATVGTLVSVPVLGDGRRADSARLHHGPNLQGKHGLLQRRGQSPQVDQAVRLRRCRHKGTMAS